MQSAPESLLRVLSIRAAALCTVMVGVSPAIVNAQDCPDPIFPTTRLVGALAPDAIAAGDLNGDGAVDLFVAGFSDYTVHLIDADGSVASQTVAVPPTFTRTADVAIGDLDRDGDLDIALVVIGEDRVGLLFNRGDGSFDRLDGTAGTNRAAAIAIGDLDGDGDLDLVVAEQTHPEYRAGVLLNNGAGEFTEPALYPVGDRPEDIVIADTDGDEIADIVTANVDDNSVSVLRGDGAGGFAAEVRFATGANPVAVDAGDLDGDGDTDLVLPRRSGQGIAVMINAGLG